MVLIDYYLHLLYIIKTALKGGTMFAVGAKNSHINRRKRENFTPLDCSCLNFKG